MKLDYEVIIPSRKRSDRLKGWKMLFPFAKLFVHESEHDDYAKVVGDENVLCHKLHGIWAIRKEMLRQSNKETVIQIDDDVKAVFNINGDARAFRKIETPEHVKQILENSLIVAKDLNINLFGWDLQGKPQYFDPTNPFRLCAVCSTAFGTIGRDIMPDERFFTSGDMDLTLQALLINRIVLMDTRYYFDNGQVGKGAGGLQGLRTSQTEKQATDLLRNKWGAHIYRGMSRTKGKMGGYSMKICVERKNPLASTR